MNDIISHIPIFGTIVNALAVITGATIGILVGRKIPERHINLAFQAFGLVTMYIGFNMSLGAENVLIMVFSLTLGAVTGEAIDLQLRVERLGEAIKSRFGGSNDSFVEGFVSSFLLYCTGSMVILGAIEEGLGKFPNLLLAKALMDGLASIALAASMGVGVVASAIPLFLYQSALTFSAKALEPWLTQPVVSEMSAVGGIILVGLSLSILDIKKIRVMNLLPSLVYAALFGAFMK